MSESPRTLAAKIAENQDPWADFDAIIVANAYLAARTFLAKMFTECYVDTPRPTRFVVDGSFEITPAEAQLIDDIFAAEEPAA